MPRIHIRLKHEGDVDERHINIYTALVFINLLSLLT